MGFDQTGGGAVTFGTTAGTAAEGNDSRIVALAALGVASTPWHVLGTIAGAAAWVPQAPEAGARGGFAVNLSTNGGQAAAINANVFVEDALSTGLTTVSAGSFRYLATSASANDARGFYCNSNARDYSVETGFLFAGRIRVPTLTTARYVFAMCEDTGVVGLLDDITSGDTQTTRYGFFLVISSTTSVAGTVSVYSSASGAASAIASTGIVAVAGEVLDVYLMSGTGALGASKTVYWQVVRRTNTEAVASGSFTANLPTSSSNLQPVFAVRTLAASAINIEAQSLSVAE